MKAYLESLEHRIAILEQHLLEGKRDQEVLNDFLGDDYYSKFTAIKNKIRDPEYKDIYKIIIKDPDEVKSYIDSIQSNSDIRRVRKSDGAKLLYSDNLWKVYFITTYPAAQLYGKGTKWCITGRYPGHEGKGEKYFNNYIKDNNLDGGYYFYIKNDGKTKYCVLQRKNGDIHSVWNADDKVVTLLDLFKIEHEWPVVKEVNINPSVSKYIGMLYSEDIKLVRQAINSGMVDINISYNDKTALDSILSGNCDNDSEYEIVKLLLDNGADPNICDGIFEVIGRRNPKIVKALLDAGADPNRLDVNNCSLLEVAVSSEWNDNQDYIVENVRSLLNAGADPNLGSSDLLDYPILAIVINNIHDPNYCYNIIKMLIDAGADTNAECEDGTVADYIIDNCPDSILRKVIRLL